MIDGLFLLQDSPSIAAANTIKAGLIGSGIQGSRSPALHLHEAAAHGLQFSYELIDLETLNAGPDRLPRLLDDAEKKGFAGLNITYPCKQIVIPYLHELSAQAAHVGAVNTVLFKDGRRIGHNTDWSGFAEAFRRGLPRAKLDTVVQLGAGGAGAATAYAALMLGVRRLSVFDQQSERANQVVSRLSKGIANERISAGTNLAEALRNADGLIHATPTGMAGHPGLPFPPQLLTPKLWICEVVYVPLETELLRVARRIGCHTLNGGGMAVLQAAEAFRLFTGMMPDTERMLDHFASLNKS
ncbi:MAG: shikimate dehydrogenase [Verrucomicrobia bacterium]|nr:shikimate dehydrogenase [Verrucomicrobiota bacterium]